MNLEKEKIQLIYDALMTISVNGKDVITMSNVLQYINSIYIEANKQKEDNQTESD